MCDASPTGSVLGALDSIVENYLYLRGSSSSSSFQSGGDLFFSDGYGDDMETMLEIRKTYRHAIYNGTVEFRLQDDDIEWREQVEYKNVLVQEGYFVSPLQHVLPPESQKCRFHLVKPIKHATTTSPTNTTTTNNVYVIMLASTGEAGKKSRLAMAQQLAQDHGYSSIILTSPYYGHRKPAGQSSFYLRTVTDLWKQFGGTLQEAAALAEYYYRTDPTCRLCWTGFSAGGALAICAAWAAVAGYRLDGDRLAVAAYVAPASAGIYARGSLQTLLDWPALRSSPTEPLEMTKRRLYENLDLLSVSSVTGIENADTAAAAAAAAARRPTNCHLGSLRFCAGTRDTFSPRYFCQVLQQQLPPLVRDPVRDCSMEWHAFGHVYAGLARPRLQKELIVNAVQPLL